MTNTSRIYSEYMSSEIHVKYMWNTLGIHQNTAEYSRIRCILVDPRKLVI